MRRSLRRSAAVVWPGKTSGAILVENARNESARPGASREAIDVMNGECRLSSKRPLKIVQTPVLSSLPIAPNLVAGCDNFQSTRPDMAVRHPPRNQGLAAPSATDSGPVSHNALRS